MRGKVRLRRLWREQGAYRPMYDQRHSAVGSASLMYRCTTAKRLGSVSKPGERTNHWQKVKLPAAVPPD